MGAKFVDHNNQSLQICDIVSRACFCVQGGKKDQDLHVFITPRACARGKVIGRVVVVIVVVSTKFAISRDIGV